MELELGEGYFELYLLRLDLGLLSVSGVFLMYFLRLDLGLVFVSVVFLMYFVNLLLSLNIFVTTGGWLPFGHPQCWSMLMEVLDF